MWAYRKKRGLLRSRIKSHYLKKYIICSFHKILIKYATKSRKAYFSGHVACVREILSKSLKGKENLGDTDVDESAICTLTFKNTVSKISNSFIYLGTLIGGRSL